MANPNNRIFLKQTTKIVDKNNYASKPPVDRPANPRPDRPGGFSNFTAEQQKNVDKWQKDVDNAQARYNASVEANTAARVAAEDCQAKRDAKKHGGMKELACSIPRRSYLYSAWNTATSVVSAQAALLESAKKAQKEGLENIAKATELDLKHAGVVDALNQANMTPAERLAKEKEKNRIEAEQRALEAKMKLEEQKLTSSSKNKKIIIIGLISVGILTALVFIVKAFKGNKSAA